VFEAIGHPVRVLGEMVGAFFLELFASERLDHVFRSDTEPLTDSSVVRQRIVPRGFVLLSQAAGDRFSVQGAASEFEDDLHHVPEKKRAKGLDPLSSIFVEKP
jgi:hypothetical protein